MNTIQHALADMRIKQHRKVNQTIHHIHRAAKP